MEKLCAPESGSPSVAGAGPVAAVPVAKAPAAETETEEEAMAASAKLFRCASARRSVPLAYREELYHVLKLTGPLLMSRILNYLLPFVITIFCGHIGNAELAGYALASATITVTTTCTGYGLGLACDTLISQTFGGNNLQRVGVILQRTMLILLIFCLPCWALLMNSQNLLLLMQQEEEVTKIAQLYVMAFLPAVPAMFLHQLQVTYLQNQGIILPQMYTAAVANVINLGVNYVLIFRLEMGVMGSAIANSFSQITICALLYGYIRCRRLHEQTWGGWSSECLQDWGAYMQLAIPSTLMVCFEGWIWEAGGFLAGMLGEVDLAAQHILLEVGSIAYMFPLGISAAACVRVGNALGAGNTTRAITTCKVALVLSGALAVLQGIVIASSRSVIGYIFTSDENIVEIVSKNLGLITFIQLFDALLCVCSGILVGAGKQKIAAVSNLVSFYIIGLPVGIALMFWAKLRILGLWMGLFICTVLQSSFFIAIIFFKLDWQKLTDKAQVRAGRNWVVMTSPKQPPAGKLLIEAVTPDPAECPEPAPNLHTAQMEGAEGVKLAGYSAVSTQEAEVSGREGGGEAERAADASGTTAPALLSATQLILRRGLTLAAAVVLLAIGVTVYIAIPPPESSAQSRTNFTSLDWTNATTPAPTTLELDSPL